MASGSLAANARAGAFNASRLIHYGVFVVTILLIVGPLVPVIYQALLDQPIYNASATLSLANFRDLFTSEAFWDSLLNTGYFAVIATLVAQVIGVVTAILVGRTDMPGRNWLGDILIWPLFISHLVLAFGWYTMYGPSGYITLLLQNTLGFAPWNLYTIPGMAFVAGVSQAPLAYLYCLAAVNAADPALEDAARSVGAKPVRVLFSVTFPLLRPAILYGLIMNFVISIEMLSIPLIFGRAADIHTFSTFLYDAALLNVVPDYGLVAAASLVLLVLVMGLIVLQGSLLANARRFVTVGGKATKPKRFALGRLRWVAFVLVAVYVLLAIFTTIGGLVLRSATEFLSPLLPFWEVFTWSNYAVLGEYPVFLQSIYNTILLASVGAALGTMLIVLIALVSYRSKFPFARHLDYVAQFPRALPGILVGLAFLYLLLGIPPLGWMRNTILALMLAYIMRYIPAGLGAVVPSLQQISSDLDASARSSGAGWWTTCRIVLLPLLRPAMFSCFALLFILFLKEYVTAIFLIAPGSEVIGTTLLQFWEQGSSGPVAALATIQILITIAFVYFARKGLGVKIYG